MATNGRGQQPGNGNSKEIIRNTYSDIVERGVPETGHTDLLPEDELVVNLPMDNGWTQAIEVGHLPGMLDQSVFVDMDPLVDPVLFWSGKRNRRNVPVLPLQRNEVVTDSRIAQIVDRVRARASAGAYQPSLFAEMERTHRDEDKDLRAEWLTHDEGWKNKLICGDSLQVMESLIQYEGMGGKVQMIYIDPPYGIRYDSNFQQRVDSTHNDEKDLADDVLTIKAFRDTWALGIHSYLTYLQERLYLCRDLLTTTGSIFVQINVENVHFVRALMDEVFGRANHYASIAFNKTTGFTDQRLSSVYDCLIWYAKDATKIKYHQLYQTKSIGPESAGVYNKVELPSGERRSLTPQELANLDQIPSNWKVYSLDNLNSQGAAKEPQPFEFEGKIYHPSPNNHWKTTTEGLTRLARKKRVAVSGSTLRYVRFYDDFPVSPFSNIWLDTGTGSFTDPKIFVVQTNSKVVARCIYMCTDPGDLVFDLTCGSGTTAYTAEMTGRRWITCDTSRVSVNIARKRLLSAAFDSYRTRGGTLSSGLIYKMVNRVTLKSLAYDLEPEKVELVNQPEVDRDCIRVTGPFEVMSLGRYSPDDWKGYVNQSGTLENYIAVICRLYRKDAAIQSSAGFVHAIAESELDRIAVSVGPLSGRVTARQIQDAVDDAFRLGINEVHVLGWAFEANVGEIVSQLEERGNTTLRLIMIRPDTLAEGLKITQPDALFSPLTLPDIDVAVSTGKGGQREATVSLKGVGLFNRKHRTTEYHQASDGYVAAWYLDEDYDGDCFVDSQMFFDFAKAPNLGAALKADINPEEYQLQLTSLPFPLGDGQRRIAVKVVDVYGNEATVVRDLA